MMSGVSLPIADFSKVDLAVSSRLSGREVSGNESCPFYQDYLSGVELQPGSKTSLTHYQPVITLVDTQGP